MSTGTCIADLWGISSSESGPGKEQVSCRPNLAGVRTGNTKRAAQMGSPSIPFGYRSPYSHTNTNNAHDFPYNSTRSIPVLYNTTWASMKVLQTSIFSNSLSTRQTKLLQISTTFSDYLHACLVGVSISHA